MYTFICVLICCLRHVFNWCETHHSDTQPSPPSPFLFGPLARFPLFFPRLLAALRVAGLHGRLRRDRANLGHAFWAVGPRVAGSRNNGSFSGLFTQRIPSRDRGFRPYVPHLGSSPGEDDVEARRQLPEPGVVHDSGPLTACVEGAYEGRTRVVLSQLRDTAINLNC